MSEHLGRDAPAAFQHALPAVPSVLLGKGSGQVSGFFRPLG